MNRREKTTNTNREEETRNYEKQGWREARRGEGKDREETPGNEKTETIEGTTKNRKTETKWTGETDTRRHDKTRQTEK